MILKRLGKKLKVSLVILDCKDIFLMERKEERECIRFKPNKKLKRKIVKNERLKSIL